MPEIIGPRFVVTPSHLVLLRRLAVVWAGGDLPFGAPAVCPKRPISSGDAVGDVIRILGWCRTGRPTDDMTERAKVLYGEMLYVVQIALQQVNDLVPCGPWQRDDSKNPGQWHFMG